jgi:hypothetical protein
MVHQKLEDILETFTLQKKKLNRHMDKNVGSQQLDIKLNFQHMSMSFSQPMFRPIC